MKAIQITFDEALLERLDADDEVRRHGRSAILRRLAKNYLERKRQAAIEAQYRRGYADFEGLGPEFDGWERMGVWPGLPSEVPAGIEEGLKHVSGVNLDHVQTVEQRDLRHFVGSLSPEKMEDVCRALAVATGCDR